MFDFTALNTAVQKLSADVDALVAAFAAQNATVQPAIDAATASVNDVDAKVLAATPPTV